MPEELEGLMGTGGTHRRPGDQDRLRWAWIFVGVGLVLLAGVIGCLCVAV